jgi:hypothetical protein
MGIEYEVRRNDDGSIDITFYKVRAQRLHQEAKIEFWRSIRELSRAWLWGLQRSISGRPVTP